MSLSPTDPVVEVGPDLTRESIVARGFAYRNAVRQMTLNGEGDRQ